MEEESNRSIEIHYEKNPLYRTIYTDGAIGGITPLNQINISFYATRNTIPKSLTLEIKKDGNIGQAISVSPDSKAGIIREIEFGVYMNRQSAKELYEFLKKIFENDTK